MFAEIAAESDDPATQTVCVLTSADGMVLSTGVNRLTAPCDDDGRADRCVAPCKADWMAHAEQVAIGTAARRGCQLDGATAYLNWHPCASCARLLVLAGVARVFVDADRTADRWDDPRYGFRVASQLLHEGGVVVRLHVNGVADPRAVPC